MQARAALSPPEPKSGRPELARLVRRLQALTFELRELRRRAEPPQPELHAKERELEQLRWRFAAIARQAATDDLGNAAMTAAAAATTGRLRGWLSARHSLGLEAALVLSLYGVSFRHRPAATLSSRDREQRSSLPELGCCPR